MNYILFISLYIHKNLKKYFRIKINKLENNIIRIN